MKILVIGGSYFFGRVFVMQATKAHDITVVNRGTYSMAQLGVKQVTGDRKSAELWKSIDEDFDVMVDFCAYEKGDIANVLQNVNGKVGQYILISTVDVKRRGIQGRKEEGAPLEVRELPGEAGSYIAGKVALEEEVRAVCGRLNIKYTVLRPAVLYGPYNYAPRESVYIKMMVQEHVLPHIMDATGAFQFVYVKDAAEAVIRCMHNERAYGQAYNLCQDGFSTYDLVFEALARAAGAEMSAVKSSQSDLQGTEPSWDEVRYTVKEAKDLGLPLPFPVTAAESELYSNEKSKRELGISYSKLWEGMEKTYRAFRRVYAG